MHTRESANAKHYAKCVQDWSDALQQYEKALVENDRLTAEIQIMKKQKAQIVYVVSIFDISIILYSVLCCIAFVILKDHNQLQQDMDHNHLQQDVDHNHLQQVRKKKWMMMIPLI